MSDLLFVTIKAAFQKPGEYKYLTVRRREEDDGYAVYTILDERTGDVVPSPASIGSTVESLCHFLSNDQTILKLKLKGNEQGGHDPTEICMLANQLLRARTLNPFKKHPVVSLESLDVSLVAQDLDFAANSLFTLGLINAKAPIASDGVQMLLATLASLNPSKLMLRLYKECSNQFIHYLGEGLKAKDCFKVLIMESMDYTKALVVTELLNMCPSVENLGFNGSFVTDVAQALDEKLEPGRYIGRVSISYTEIHGNLAKLLGKLLTEKWSELKTLQLINSSLTQDAFGIICAELQQHKNLKTLSVVSCQLTIGRASVVPDGVGRLFQNNQTIVTIKLDDTNAETIDPNTWQHLAGSKALQIVSMHRSFQDTTTWLDFCKRLASAMKLEICWLIKDGETYSQKLKFSETGYVVVSPVESMDGMPFKLHFVLDAIKQVPEASHRLVITHEAALSSRLAKILPDIVSCKSVETLDILFSSKEPAIGLMNNYLASVVDPRNKPLTLLQDVAPRIHASFKNLQFSWPPVSEPDYEDRAVPNAISINMTKPTVKPRNKAHMSEAHSNGTTEYRDEEKLGDKQMLLKWKCLCGEFTAQVTGEPNMSYFCHCRNCRRFNGNVSTPFALYSSIQIMSGENNLIRYAGSSHGDAKMARASCRTCGSYCFGAELDGTTYYVPVGALQGADETKVVEPDMNIFCGSLDGHLLRSWGLPKFETYPDVSDE